jgi:putative ABC transport system substrate-binding protein
VIRRREFIAGLGAASAWPVAARAQQPDRMRRIGMLVGDSNFQPGGVPDFRDAMAKFGRVDGRNVRIDVRAGDGDADRFGIYAVELVRLTPDVIVTSSAAATRAVQQETQTIPIVTAGVGDPIVNGIVKNLARPEGNTTGTTNLFSSIGGKWL